MDPVLIKKGKTTKSVFQVDLPAWLEDGWKVEEPKVDGLRTAETAAVEGEASAQPAAARRAKTAKEAGE